MTKQTVRRATSRAERAWEVVPGILEWSTFSVLILLSWLAPYVVSYMIMMYALYWLIKTAHVNTHLVYTYRKLKKSSRQDWHARLHDLDEPERALERVEKALATLRAELRSGTFRSRRRIKHAIEALAERRRVLKDLQAREDDLPSWREVWHVVIFPTYNEPIEVLEESIGALLKSKFPLDRVAVVVGVEERAGDEAVAKAHALKNKFAGKFAHFWTVTHPDGLVGEARVKSANATYALNAIAPDLTKQGIPTELTLVSNFDADTQASPEYFSVLTEAFVTNPRRLRASYQPIPVFNNNFWGVPLLSRLSAIGSSFWQMIEASRVQRLVTFSSHAVPLKVLLEVGGWDVTRISEDSRIFWQSYIHFDGDYFVVPLPTTVSMDAVQAHKWTNTLTSLYKQKRRWAYGAENLPLVGTSMLGKNHIKASLGVRLAQVGRMLEASYSLGTAAVVLAVGGWLPSLLGGPVFRDTVLGQNFLNVTRFLLTFALIGVVFSIGVSASMLPKRPKGVPRRRVFNYWIQWIFAPFATIFFGSIPAVDAHTRLMLGRYMEFQVMPKVRTESKETARSG